MGDYDWMSPEHIEVGADGLRQEAKKWHALADRMNAAAGKAANQTLTAGAFSVVLDYGITTTDLNDAYQQMHAWLTSLLRQAVTEFDAMGQALRKNADAYEQSDAGSMQSFDAIADS